MKPADQQWQQAAMEANRLRASNAELTAALVEAEAVFSIVAPRSNTAEYIRVLGVVRAALEAHGVGIGPIAAGNKVPEGGIGSKQ